MSLCCTRFYNLLYSYGSSNFLEINSGALWGVSSHRLTLHHAAVFPNQSQPRLHGNLNPTSSPLIRREKKGFAVMAQAWNGSGGGSEVQLRRMMRLNQTEQTSLKTGKQPPSRLCSSHFSAKPHSKHLIKPILLFSHTYCALLFNIFAKYPWYCRNSSILIKGGGFLIKGKWQIAVAELSRSLFNQRIVEKKKAITEWIKAGICKEMSGREKRYLSHWLKSQIWSWL